MQLGHAHGWHLHVLLVTLVGDGLDEVDGLRQVPVHELLDLPADAHVGLATLPLELTIEVALEELTRDGYGIALSPLTQPLRPWREVALIVLDSLLLRGASLELSMKRGQTENSTERQGSALSQENPSVRPRSHALTSFKYVSRWVSHDFSFALLAAARAVVPS